MKAKFEDGTRVQLKSGGPIMTVDSYDENTQKYLCEWFKDGKLYKESFRETSLEEFVPGEFGIY
ncbi:DUF2158 domain-containing protein [Klebsiella variicola subsp. variicola]|uniref:YodC family protein n=1 Tax=Klebsiella variicola TaxID=244366 RepID=UPI001E12EA75|nr:DUF2158 domain-containing protein [Klebsiella variicola]MCB8421762.1 DUF2158 domain-containing protein [Klebsiella variicola subsp. variicola]MCB8442673.1 DUF2158 domain-containing protein [Klebsiella variicola subsp. variicola]MCB8495402.1 DUF2158 domain-containing protein [Klebsiella variicola subsp. variicola]